LQGVLEGLPELQDLNLYGNKIAEIVVPHDPTLLSKLDVLNMGYNDLAYLPDDLDQFKSLKTLKVMNNFLEKIPMRICDMDLRSIDVSANPVTQPPIETCERGICSMKRYYHCLRLEEQSKQRALEEVQRRAQRQQRTNKSSSGGAPLLSVSHPTAKATPAKKKYGAFFNGINPLGQLATMVPQSLTSTVARRALDESANTSSSDKSLTTGPATPAAAVATGQQTSSLLSGSTGILAESSSKSLEQSTPPARINASTKLSVAVTTTSPAIASSSSKEPLSPKQRTTLKMPSETISSVSSALATPPKDEVLQTAGTDSSVLPAGALVKPSLHKASSDESAVSTTESSSGNAVVSAPPRTHDEVTVNETLKVIFVGMAMVGKTSMIKRLIKGRDAVIPKHDERTVGVDIYEWDLKKDKRFEHIDSRIEIQDKELMEACGGDKHVMFSVWDFAGQHVYHATHELFFSPRALYVLVWDMGATNRATLRQKASMSEDAGPFKLTYDSESEDGESDHEDNILEEARRADRALEHDIDEKVQFWVDCIQSSAPGAAILPVASFSDYFANDGGEAEAIRRCNILKQRLIKHEDRRIKGIKERLKEYEDNQRPDDPAAARLRKLLCSFTRPKLIFGNGHEDSIVRVSGTKYTGFDKLTEKIVGIATGRDKGQWRWPIFHGQVGARIPRMRLEVRDVVREMRIRFKVVEWGYFISQLRERGLTSVEDISDALHFLTNTGELSYFGGVMSDNERVANPVRELLGSPTRVDVPSCTLEKDGMERTTYDHESQCPDEEKDDDEDDMDDDEDHAILSMDDTAITAPSTEDGSLTTVEDYMSSGLSQFVFLNPRWLVEAVACILRHDLDREIQETRRMMAAGRSHTLDRTSSFTDAHLNCPVITAENACMLWQAKRITKKAAERAQEHSNNMAVTPFEFLQLLLIRFGVFVPIDLSIEKAFLGGKEYTRPLDSIEADTSVRESSDAGQATREVSVLASPEETALKAKFFFLPSLLGPGEPSEAWTYKNAEGWKTTLCHSILFPDGVPPGLMERLTASVLSSIYAVSNRSQVASTTDMLATYEGRLTVREVLCWRTAFLLKLGTVLPSSDGTNRESIVEIFALLADRESHLCVGSDYMGVGTRRLIISGRGQVGDGGKKIWKGGYLLVAKCVRRVMDAYGGLEYEKQAFCPECLAKNPVSECSSWDYATLLHAVSCGEKTLKCRHLGHPVETRLVTGPHNSASLKKEEPAGAGVAVMDPSAPVKVPELMGAVVLVGLWNGKSRKIERAGSGFIVDRKRGLIVTASHVLMNIWGDQNYPFGENYYGNPQGKVVIGVIPQQDSADPDASRFKAVFRYFAKVVVKDPGLEKDECHLDACVLRITTRMENDVDGDGEGCAEQPEILLLNNAAALKSEKLPALKITDKCELEEQVRILGYNQGGEGLIGPGESLNRYADFARGYVCKLGTRNSIGGASNIRDRFKPLEEVAVMCHTIGGHSGGPCVNQQGEVIGILSRADPAESQRCYISPTSAWKDLVKQAKKTI
jgi:GTPase SAR1 family protein